MTKDPRDPRKWENPEIEQDGEGYTRAQLAFAEDQKAAEQEQRDDTDERYFVERFVREGGSRRDARAAYRRYRSEQAAKSAAAADEQARTYMSAATRRAI